MKINVTVNKTVFLFVALFFIGNSFSQSNNLLVFDGTNDYVNLDALQTDFYNNASNFSIEFWMNADYNDQGDVRTAMFAINQPAGENRLLFMLGGTTNQDGKLLIYDQVPGSGPLYVSDVVIGDASCHHIAYIYDGTNGKVYIDGVLKDTHSPTFTFTSADRYSLGQEWDNTTTSQFYKGQIDDLRIWDYARTDSEVSTGMDQQLNGTESGLIAYYDFDQGTAAANNTTVNVLSDKTTNGIDGNLINFSLNGTISNWIVSSCVEKYPASIKDQDQIGFDIAVYPNPCVDHVNLVLDLSENSILLISLFDIEGRLILNLPPKLLNSGQFQQILNLQGISSGSYLVQIQIGEFVTVKKIFVSSK